MKVLLLCFANDGKINMDSMQGTIQQKTDRGIHTLPFQEASWEHKKHRGSADRRAGRKAHPDTDCKLGTLGKSP